MAQDAQLPPDVEAEIVQSERVMGTAWPMSKTRAHLRQLRERIQELERLLPDWPGATAEGRRELLDGYLDRLARLRVEAERE